MEAALFIKSMEARGIVLELTDAGEIGYTAPVGTITDQVLEDLREHKVAVVSLLAGDKRRAKVATWPRYLRASFEKVKAQQRREGLSEERAEALAFVVHKRASLFLADLEAAVPFEVAMGRFTAGKT